METPNGRLGWVRATKGYTLKQLSELTGLTPGALSDGERGKNDVTVRVALALKKATGVSIDWLLTGEGEPWPKKEAPAPPPLPTYSTGDPARGAAIKRLIDMVVMSGLDVGQINALCEIILRFPVGGAGPDLAGPGRPLAEDSQLNRDHGAGPEPQKAPDNNDH